jgi:hypothetical protein
MPRQEHVPGLVEEWKRRRTRVRNRAMGQTDLFIQTLGPWKGRRCEHFVRKQKVCVSETIFDILGKMTGWARESEERLGDISWSVVRTPV